MLTQIWPWPSNSLFRPSETCQQPRPPQLAGWVTLENLLDSEKKKGVFQNSARDLRNWGPDTGLALQLLRAQGVQGGREGKASAGGDACLLHE